MAIVDTPEEVVMVVEAEAEDMVVDLKADLNMEKDSQAAVNTITVYEVDGKKPQIKSLNIFRDIMIN